MQVSQVERWSQRVRAVASLRLRRRRRRDTTRRLVLISIGLTAMCSGPLWAAQLCERGDVRIVVDTNAHRLVLCEGGKAAASFDVRLGRGGVGKTKEGDHKTPLGTYALGKPRKSQRFGMFIPIAFPTEEQRRQGYTGSDVGVHGPHRWVRWLGRLVNTFDSSDGCLGVATDKEIEDIAAWTQRSRASIIEIR